LVEGTTFNDVAVGGDPAGRNQHPTSLAFTLP
jgi:hypothetical protein